MSFLANFSRKVARGIDFTNASLAPLDTNGARPEPHAAEKRLVRLGQLLTMPALSPVDVVCYSNLSSPARFSYFHQSYALSKARSVMGLMID